MLPNPKAASKTPGGKAPAGTASATKAPVKNPDVTKVIPAAGLKRKRKIPPRDPWDCYIYRGMLTHLGPPKRQIGFFSERFCPLPCGSG